MWINIKEDIFLLPIAQLAAVIATVLVRLYKLEYVLLLHYKKNFCPRRKKNY